MPSNSRAIVKSLLVSEDTNTATTITVDLFDADPSTGNKFNLFKTQAVAGNETLQLLTEPLIMLENEFTDSSESAMANSVLWQLAQAIPSTVTLKNTGWTHALKNSKSNSGTGSLPSSSGPTRP